MSRVVWSGDLATERVRAAAMDALEDAAEFLLQEANETAPIEEATLIRSGTVSVDRSKGVARISYDTPYARRQHEDTRLRHDPGRRAKWLERTLNEQATRVGRYIGDQVRKKVR